MFTGVVCTPVWVSLLCCSHPVVRAAAALSFVPVVRAAAVLSFVPVVRAVAAAVLSFVPVVRAAAALSFVPVVRAAATVLLLLCCLLSRLYSLLAPALVGMRCIKKKEIIVSVPEGNSRRPLTLGKP